MKHRITAYALLIALVVMLASTSVACFGRTPSKEQLLSNIEREPLWATDVVDAFEAWDMPSFYGSYFVPYFDAYEVRMEKHGVTMLQVARLAARTFVAEWYDLTDLKDPYAVTDALIRCYEQATETLCPPLTDPEQLRAAIDPRSESDYAYAAMYLLEWGFPSFDTQKMMTVEYVIAVNFYKNLPDDCALAVALAEDFLDEYMAELDICDRAAVTDAYLYAYVDQVRLLDRYAEYRCAEEYEDYVSDHTGNYVGIGITVQVTDGEYEPIPVTAVNAEGPADLAGMRVGDLIVAVDGRTIEQLGGYDAAVNAVRGEEGTEVTVTVLRGEDTLDLTMTRRAVTTKTVEWSIDGELIGYVQISGFKASTAEQFFDAIDALEAAGVRGIVFDVRGNPGGALTAIADVLSYLVPDGTEIVSFGDYDDPILSDTDRGGVDHVLSVPVAVLCNGGTASAAELFAAAMRDWSDMGLVDATLVGTTTYKKGIMQTTYTLFDYSTVTMTVAEYNPPCRVNYDGIGVIPDEIVELPSGAEEDVQLLRAYELLRLKLFD